MPSCNIAVSQWQDGKKETAAHPLSRRCQLYATPSSNSSRDHDLSAARTVKNGSAMCRGVNKSTKVVLGRVDKVPKPDAHGDEMDESDECIGQFVVASGDTTSILETVEASFDPVPQCINGTVDRDLYVSAFLGDNIVRPIRIGFEEGPGEWRRGQVAP
jgi:hypothetical protein